MNRIIPGPVTFVTAGLAAVAAVGVGAAAAVMTAWSVPGAVYFTSVGKTLLAMPIWVIIGSTMSQIAKTIVKFFEARHAISTMVLEEDYHADPARRAELYARMGKVVPL